MSNRDINTIVGDEFTDLNAEDMAMLTGRGSKRRRTGLHANGHHYNFLVYSNHLRWHSNKEIQMQQILS